jgi:hypothetical protein
MLSPVAVSAGTVEPVGYAGQPLTAALTCPRSSGSTAMNAKSVAVVSALPMNAAVPNCTPSMSRTGCLMWSTQCAAVPR